MRVYQVVQRILGALLLLPSGSIAAPPDGVAAPHGSDGIVLVRIIDGSNEVVQVRLRDGAERQITSTAERQETWPFWSPPTGLLVYQTDRAADSSRLFLWSAEGGERPLDDRKPRAAERWADFSRAQPRLAYIRGRHVFVAELGPDATPPRSLLRGGRHVLVRPIWGPNGHRLVIQRRPSARGVSKLWLADVDGGWRQLTYGSDWFDAKPRFSYDGERVVYTRHPAEEGSPRQLAVVPVAGGEARPLLAETDADEHSASLSPTRNEIAYISDRGGRPQLYRIDLDGGEPQQLTDFPGSVWAPHFSPDGERIVATVRDGIEAPRLGNREELAKVRVMVFDRDGKVLYETHGFMPDWMPAWP